MYIIPITFETFDDPPEMVTQNCAFNISKREWMEMQIADQSISDVIQAIIDSKSNEQIVNYLKELVLKAYGVRARDEETGKMTRFRKSEELRNDFRDSGAFDKLIEDMTMTNEDPIVAFIKGILPNSISETPEFQKVVEDSKAKLAASTAETAPVPQTT